MESSDPSPSVALKGDVSASALLQAVVADAAESFPDAFAGIGDLAGVRKNYSQVLPVFEAMRLQSDARGPIAERMLAAHRAFVIWRGTDGEKPLHEALAEPSEPLPLKRHVFTGGEGWAPTFVDVGVRWEADSFDKLGAALVGRDVITPKAGEALTWMCEHQLADGRLNLSGRKIAMLGANAEMAPTKLWLEAGAEVLWLDVAPPPADLLNETGFAGTLVWAEGGADLLTQPREVLATLIEFAGGDAVDLGLYAYAPGKAREVRLTAVMNALVDALPRELVASVTILVSPTTPTALDATDRKMMAQRRDSAPLWSKTLASVGLLGRGDGSETVGEASTTRTVVSIQGASYQAAQYFGKILAAEAWASAGLRVSANTAAITRTRSLAHPVFTAAFGGARAFGVETMTPRQSRRLNGLLAVRDWMVPERPTPGAVRVHGGIHTLPYPLESALRVAAAIGFARSPRLIKGLFSR